MKYCILFNVILSITGVFTSCSSEKVCGSNKEAKDLPFISEFIDKYDSEEIASNIDITHYKYQEEDIFVLKFPDGHFAVYNCDGTVLCASGESCSHIFENVELINIVWSNH